MTYLQLNIVSIKKDDGPNHIFSLKSKVSLFRLKAQKYVLYVYHTLTL